MDGIIQFTSLKYVESFNRAVDIVARERKYLATVEGFLLDGTIQFVTSIIENNYAQYLLIFDNEVKGWCDIIPKSIPEFSHVGVLGMGLLPEYRGKGFGQQLIEITLQHVNNNSKIEKVELNVFESNENAIKLYRKFGFFEEGKRLKSRKIDGMYDNEILMGKFI